jgi:hypothetical protein
VQRLPKLFQLPVGDISPSPARNCAELQRTNPRSNQPDNRIADFFEHAPHDPVAPFVDHHPHQRAVVHIADWTHDSWNGAFAINDDSTSHPFQHRGWRMTVQEHLVLFVDFEPWVCYTIGDVAIIREQQEPLSRAVQPANWDDRLGHLHQVHDGAAVSFVRRRGDVPGGLVQQYVAMSIDWEELAVDFDLLSFWIDLDPLFPDYNPVDAYASLSNQLFSLAS